VLCQVGKESLHGANVAASSCGNRFLIIKPPVAQAGEEVEAILDVKPKNLVRWGELDFHTSGQADPVRSSHQSFGEFDEGVLMLVLRFVSVLHSFISCSVQFHRHSSRVLPVVLVNDAHKKASSKSLQ
jgi:hypothetical protein